MSNDGSQSIGIAVWAFCLLLFVCLAIRRERGRKQSTTGRAAVTPSRGVLAREPPRYDRDAPAGSLIEIDAAIEAGDWNTARRWLQKIAYTMVGNGVPQHEKDSFKALMTRFAARDPAYRIILDRLLPLIRSNPGIRQALFTKGRTAQEAELIRYVFYFADVMGEIRRQKKGNSYLLYPPG